MESVTSRLLGGGLSPASMTQLSTRTARSTAPSVQRQLAESRLFKLGSRSVSDPVKAVTALMVRVNLRRL